MTMTPTAHRMSTADIPRRHPQDTLGKAQPTIFFAVPRVWEKFAELIQVSNQRDDVMQVDRQG